MSFLEIKYFGVTIKYTGMYLKFLYISNNFYNGECIYAIHFFECNPFQSYMLNIKRKKFM